ncbi:hypothetical protein D9758_015520 [Tetrapyrgos nigripes]|uniref:Nephrocystin 3-like N-terminal domain-containing protein n=1 Tax=Tetrapyrgos nigripes TaxID=182062 RepID=A0A8H5CWP2_9AGAR|nr:hypothetical protein D9758_015520 [Tetrapyrgos nigripes]
MIQKIPNFSFFQNASYNYFQGSTFNAVGHDQHIQIHYGQQISQHIRQNNPIDNMPKALKALHNADAGQGQTRKACTEGTRTEILSAIINWAMGNSTIKTMGYWICGMAGTGKSTIAMSVCIELEKQNLLGATFFCSRQIPECRDHSLIIPTIAYKLASHLQVFAATLVETLRNEPEVFSKPPSIQLNLLLINPWNQIARTNIQPTVVVVDALDECEDISSVLSALIPAIHNQMMPGLKFLFTSRPERYIQKHLRIDRPLSYGSEVDGMFLHDVEETLVKEDIMKFITAEFKELMIPGKDTYIKELAEKSGKSFIYAATMVKFILARPGLVRSRLKEAYSQTTSRKHQTQILDDLYSHVIKTAIPRDYLSLEETGDCLKVLHTIILVGRPVSCLIISNLLELEFTMVEEFVKDLQSVLYISNSDSFIYIFHTSFRDHILTESRTEPLYACKPWEHHAMLSRRCFNTLMKLKFNICDLPSSFLADKDVPGMEQKLKNIDDTLRYACNNWGYHLSQSDMGTGVVSQVKTFLEEKMMFWIEAMNLIGDLLNCSEIILSLEKV